MNRMFSMVEINPIQNLRITKNIRVNMHECF